MEPVAGLVTKTYAPNRVANSGEMSTTWERGGSNLPSASYQLCDTGQLF